jgi:hypothetical protein
LDAGGAEAAGSATLLVAVLIATAAPAESDDADKDRCCRDAACALAEDDSGGGEKEKGENGKSADDMDEAPPWSESWSPHVSLAFRTPPPTEVVDWERAREPPPLQR